jgi:hypothetical protein
VAVFNSYIFDSKVFDRGERPLTIKLPGQVTPITASISGDVKNNTLVANVPSFSILLSGGIKNNTLTGNIPSFSIPLGGVIKNNTLSGKIAPISAKIKLSLR